MGLEVGYPSMMIVTPFIRQIWSQWTGEAYYFDYAATHYADEDHCTLTMEHFLNCIDLFFFLHLIGWAAAAVFLRSPWMAFYFSLVDEVVEKTLWDHQPVFRECWWDWVILDTFGCNFLGCLLGQLINRKLNRKQVDSPQMSIFAVFVATLLHSLRFAMWFMIVQALMIAPDSPFSILLFSSGVIVELLSCVDAVALSTRTGSITWKSWLLVLHVGCTCLLMHGLDRSLFFVILRKLSVMSIAVTWGWSLFNQKRATIY